MDIERNYAQELWHVGKMDAQNCIMCFYTDDNLQVKTKSKCYILKKSFPNRLCDNPPRARRKETNNLDQATEGNNKTKQSHIETQGNHSANFTSLPTVPVLTQENRRCKVGNTTMYHCTKAGIAIKLDNQSENMVSDRNCRLYQGDKTAHLIGEEERQEIPHILMEGNYTAEYSKVLKTFA